MMMDDQKDNATIPLDEYSKSKISSAAKIAGTAAILSIAATCLGIIGFFVKGVQQSIPAAREGFNDNLAKISAQDNIFSILIGTLISGLLFYFLYSFSNSTKKAIERNDPVLLVKGLKNLGSYFKTWGIIFFIFIGIILIAVVFGGLGAAMK